MKDEERNIAMNKKEKEAFYHIFNLIDNIDIINTKRYIIYKNSIKDLKVLLNLIVKQKRMIEILEDDQILLSKFLLKDIKVIREIQEGD